jgi:small subunit ribosomal protein S3
MEEKKFIRLKKEEYGIKEYIKRDLGKGKISKLDIEYTPVGEKIIISTSKPGLVIGRRGEKIDELTQVLKTKFKLENPHIEIKEIEFPIFDAQLVADEIAMSLEKMGNLKFKVIAYKKLQEIINSGALGCELRLSGKLPSDRAKSWRFAQGYLKKAGESRREVNRAEATALTKLGITGIKVAIMPPNARIYDRIDINDEIKNKIKHLPINQIELKKEEPKKKNKRKEESKEFNEESQEERREEDNKEVVIEGNRKLIEERVLKSEEDGTAMLIEEEIEEGVPQEIIDEELTKKIEKNKKGAKLE